MNAVITGDIVNSTRLIPAEEKRLIDGLSKLLKPFPFTFYRGDSFQVYIPDSGQALTIALQCRTLAIGFRPEAAEKITDLRMAIGLGEVNQPVNYPGSASGEAFLLSGRIFDEMEKTGPRLFIGSAIELANAGLDVLADYIDAICRRMTVKQAVVIFELLLGQSQQETALKLKKSRSTVNQHVTAGGWDELEKLIGQYRHLINLLNR
jgi:hypothetical protein